MSSCTILYIGFSFTDGYLNDVRSQVLSMLDGTMALNSPQQPTLSPKEGPGPGRATPPRGGDGWEAASGAGSVEGCSPRSRGSMAPDDTRQCPPIAYAIINDQSTLDCNYLRRHEGVHVLTWSSVPNKADPSERDWKVRMARAYAIIVARGL
jgi:hypothetical protein